MNYCHGFNIRFNHSMYPLLVIYSEANDSSKKCMYRSAASINIMAPVENPKCTVSLSNGKIGGSFRDIGVATNGNAILLVPLKTTIEVSSTLMRC
uniref:ZP domain-containing protein n=1 Tax=Heterorhabditis bacteriophora TaxID=37862 RepID=A0A1I7X711_HETBA